VQQRATRKIDKMYSSFITEATKKIAKMYSSFIKKAIVVIACDRHLLRPLAFKMGSRIFIMPDNISIIDLRGVHRKNKKSNLCRPKAHVFNLNSGLELHFIEPHAEIYQECIALMM